MSDATSHMLGFATIEELRNASGLAVLDNDVITGGVSAAAVIGALIGSIEVGWVAHPDRTAASVPAILGWALNHLADTRPDLPAVAQAQELIAAHTSRGVPIVPIAELLPLLDRIHIAVTGPPPQPDCDSATDSGLVSQEHPKRVPAGGASGVARLDGGEPIAPDGTHPIDAAARLLRHEPPLRMRTPTGHSIRLTTATVEVGRLLLDAAQPMRIAKVARQLERVPGTVETALHRLGILGWTTITTEYNPTVGKTHYYTLNHLGRANVQNLSGTSAVVPLTQELDFPDALTAVGARVQTIRSIVNPTNTPANRGSDPFVRQLGALGERVRALRQSRAWSQQDLANRTEIHRANISRIESGKKNTTLEVLWRLARVLQIHWADLLDDRITSPPEAQHSPTPFEQQLHTFGTRAYQARALQRITQQALADRTGIGRSTISWIEDGTQNVTLETLSRLAAGLGVHWAGLLDDRDQHHADDHPPAALRDHAGELAGQPHTHASTAAS